MTQFKTPETKKEMKQEDISKRIGFAKGLFTIPDDFDEIDLSEDFDEEVFC